LRGTQIWNLTTAITQQAKTMSTSSVCLTLPIQAHSSTELVTTQIKLQKVIIGAHQIQQSGSKLMRDAIAKQSHPILFSLCEWGKADVITWGNATGSSWRTTGDITRKSPARSSTKVEELRTDMSQLLCGMADDSIFWTAKWSGISQTLNGNSFLLNAVDFWGHNDVDMLEVGNGALTAAETRTHFAFWAAMKWRLLSGTNVKLSSPYMQNIGPGLTSRL